MNDPLFTQLPSTVKSGKDAKKRKTTPIARQPRLSDRKVVGGTTDASRGWLFFDLILSHAGVQGSEATRAALVDLHLETIDVTVTLDGTLGELAVAIDERLHGAREDLFALRAHEDQAIAQGLELGLVLKVGMALHVRFSYVNQPKRPVMYSSVR